MSVAIDQWYHRRQKDVEGDFYRKIAGQSPQNNFNATTQGLFLATPDGKLLGFTNHRSPDWEPEPLRFIGVRYTQQAFAGIDARADRTGKPPSGPSLARYLGRH